MSKGAKVGFWLIMTIIAVIFLVININDYKKAENAVKIAENDVWTTGKELGKSDAEIQAAIDAAKAQADFILPAAHASNESEAPISQPMRQLLKDAEQVQGYLDGEVWDVEFYCKDPMQLMKGGVFESCEKVLAMFKMHIGDAINQSRADIDNIKGAAVQ